MKRLRLVFMSSVCLWEIILNCSIISAAQAWKELKTHHFIVYYQNASPDVIEKTVKIIEDSFQEISDNLSIRPYPQWRGDYRVKIYIYDDKEGYHQDNKEIEDTKWSGGFADRHQNVIKIYLNQLDYFFEILLPHELGHLLLDHYVGSRADFPPWFSEGIAQLQEKIDHKTDHDIVREYFINNEYLSLSDLKDDNKGTFEHYYKFSMSATQYLVKRLPGNKSRLFLDLLKEGKSFSAALNKATNGHIKNIKDLNDQWVREIQDSKFVSPSVTVQSGKESSK